MVRKKRWDHSRAAEAPAQIPVRERKQSVVVDAQRYTVDVGPRPGAKTSMKVVGDTVSMGDPVNINDQY